VSTFAGLLQRHRLAGDLTRYDLARRMACDPSMLWRLEHDERVPSRALVLTAANALFLDTPDTDRLLLAAGYAPDWLVALAGVARVLPKEDRHAS
jgi:transcriptional regulator with XRE-family HTH domain